MVPARNQSLSNTGPPNGFTAGKQRKTSRIVTAQESGKARKRIFNVCIFRKTVKIQMMRKAQVPSTVAAAGRDGWPVPRSTPDGISYRQQTGSKNKMYRILVQELAITAGSVENSPEKASRKITIGTIMIRENRTEDARHNPRMCLHLFFCPAAKFWLVNVVAVCPKDVMT